MELARVARQAQRHMSELGAGKAQAPALNVGGILSLGSLKDEAQRAEGAFGASSVAASSACQLSGSTNNTPTAATAQQGAGRAGIGAAVVSTGDLG